MSHSHTTYSTGSHTHSAGTLDLTGSVPNIFTRDYWVNNSTGVFETSVARGSDGCTYKGSDNFVNINFKASGHWSGETSSSGGHSHSTNYCSMSYTDNNSHSHSTDSQGSHNHTIGSTGNGEAFSIMNPYIVKYIWERVS